MPVLTMDFVPVPEPKTVKNRIHWDVTVPGVAALVQARATVLREPGGDVRWHVLADPEGNEFRAFTGRRASPCARHPGARRSCVAATDSGQPAAAPASAVASLNLEILRGQDS